MFPGISDPTPRKHTREGGQVCITLRLTKEAELDAMDVELETDIVTIIPDKSPGADIMSILSESKATT